MNRKEFLQLSTAIIGGMGLPRSRDNRAEAHAPVVADSLDDSYLELGLTGMAKSKGWFDAHWGAAVLAGYYLCKDNELDKEVAQAVKGQLDALIALRGSQFTALPAEPADEALIETIPGALAPAMQGGLRAHGHAVIFASLGTKALRDVKHMAQPKLIKGLCGLSQQIARKPPVATSDSTPYADSQAMVESTFDSIIRFRGVLGRPSISRPNFTHMTTHSEALLNLESMGYSDLVRLGHAGHRAHIGVPVPEFDPSHHPLVDGRVTLEDIMSESFWEDSTQISQWNRKWDESASRNGYWVAFGHLFKVLYSYHRLAKQIENPEKVRLCSMILLERYLNPEVQGG